MDIDKTLATARETAAPAFLNRRILHTIPLEFRIDGNKVLGDPIGMKGVRLETDCLFITCLAQHDSALAGAVEDADIEVIDEMAAPLASASVLLDGEQRMKGCVLANIGAETISVVVYDEGMPISVKVFPMGSGHITEDIALGFRISLEEAERVKLQRLTGQMYPRKKVDDLIATRLLAMFTLVEKHLKTLSRHHHLPAGIIISGGGSGVGSISDIAKDSLKLPARLAEFRVPTDAKMRDATWAVAYGLARWGLTGETSVPKKSVLTQFSKFFKQFLP
jgi:cell division protein FtsA